MNLLKKCTKCGVSKSIKEFATDKSKCDGLYSSCDDCRGKLYKKPIYKSIRRKAHLKRAFGLTPDEYNIMVKKQNGRCAICNGKNKNNWNLAIDHDHKTGKIRQLLCASCNVILGTAYDDINILKAAIKYLQKHND